MNDSARQRIAAILPLLKDSSNEVRTAAAQAIERLEGAGSLDEIFDSLKKGDLGAKVRAIYALGEIGGERVIAPLVYCAGRPEADIRAAAVEMLGKQASPDALPVLVERLGDENSAIRARALAALAGYPPTPKLVEKVLPFLKEDDGMLEAEAALTISRLGDSTVVEQILPLLSSSHAATRSAAAIALSFLRFR